MFFKNVPPLDTSSAWPDYLYFIEKSFREEIRRLSKHGLIPFLVFCFAFWIVCAAEWTQKLAGTNPDPRFWTILSLVVTAYSGLQVFRLRPQTGSFRVGRNAERAVIEILDRLRGKGFVSFHHLRSSGLNVDHVVVGPSGIYAIETKTRSGSGVITYGGGHDLIFGGRIKDRRPLRHAQNSARAVHRELAQHLHQSYWVKPLLVEYGNWQVCKLVGDFVVDVVTADQLQDHLEQQQPELTSKEIAQICSLLAR